MEFLLAPRASRLFLGFARLMNSSLFRGRLHFQALGTNFRVWSDGIVSPLFEELPSASRLIACEYEDVEGRRALLDDPAFVAEFRRDWLHGRQGWDLARLKTRLGMPDHLVMRDLDRLHFDGAPVADWEGESLQAVYERAQRFQAGDEGAARSEAEREALARVTRPLEDDADFMLHLLREYDRDFRFWTDLANIGNRATLDYLLHDCALPGFNDSGAHITNMAFFDTNLMSLKLAQEQGLETVGRMVRRLTREPAEFFGLDVGTLDIGAQADLVIINPEILRHWDCNETRELIYREIFQHRQMVNRPPAIVEQVYVRGVCAWRDGEFSETLGTQPLGRALRAA
jgi:N-acyl-D-aspartate/D-glutamate deacylase